VYVAGSTSATLPGQSRVGNNDVFVRKYDLDGGEMWTRQFGTSETDFIQAISVNPSGVYLAGYTYGVFTTGGGSSGGIDAFVRRYDLNGTEIWTRQFGTSAEDQATGIALDVSGVYVAGYTYGVFPGAAGAGSIDAFVRKYDLNGAEVWTQQFGTSGS